MQPAPQRLSRTVPPLARSAGWCATLLLLLLAGTALPGRAGDNKYAGEFLKIGVGARALAMGGAFVAVADDASAAYWNPAGLAGLSRSELLFMHSEHFGSQANHDYFGFVQPLGGGSRASAIGVGLIRFAVDNILVTRDAYDDLNGNGEHDPGEPILTDQFTSDSDTEYGLLLTYAREASDRWSLGGNVKLLRQGLLGNTSFGMGLDLGALYQLQPGVTVGARLADATTTQISWDTGHREKVMPTLSLGVQVTRGFAPLRGTLTLAGNLAMYSDGRDKVSQLGNGADFQGGAEYWYDQVVAARLGTDAGNFTAGAGLRLFHGLGVDYAFLAHDELDDTHRVSASFRF